MTGGGFSLAKLLLSLGALLLVLGLALFLLEKLGIRGGRLPGDIRIEGEHGTFYFPIVTCIVVSLVITLILQLFKR